jgi:5-methylthioadenosine/S-adenosylhomocysteine deaminase
VSGLTVVGSTFAGVAGGVRSVDGVIAAIGSEVTPEPGDEVLDATGGVLLPGLVNGHTHAAMTLFRGYGDDLPLMQWLQEKIWPAEAKLTYDDVYWGTRLAVAEMLRSGTVRAWDMYWHGDAVAAAVVDGGMRAAVSSVVIDGLDAAKGTSQRPEIVDQLDAIAAAGTRVTPSLGPHAVYTVSPETLTWIGEVARERGIPVQIHCSETEDEVTSCRTAHGVSPVGLLERCGVLGERTVLAHCVWVDDDDLELIARSGSTIVTNPVSNAKLAVGGVFRTDAAAAHGIPVGLGTDGASSNNSLDLLADVKFLALEQKHELHDPAAMPATEAWAIVTGACAPALGQSGQIAVGEPADFVVVRDDHGVLGPGDLVNNLVYAATGSVVAHVVVDGHVVVRNGAVDGEEEIRARAYECARRLGVTST